MKSKLLISTLLTALVFASCKDQTFKKKKAATKEIHSLDGSRFIKIESYNLTYNPKSNGFIRIELENGAQYEAKSVDGGSFSSINLLLKDKGVLFDTTRKEVVINKSIEN